jgi:hypothetical protein
MRARHASAGAVLAIGFAISGAPLARAHDVRPAVLALKEVAPGRFAMHWSPPSDGTPAFSGTRPTFPAHCRPEGVALIDCGERGLVGAIRFEGGAAFSGVSVDIEWFRGPRELRVASGDPAIVLLSGTPARASFADYAGLVSRYAAMGVEHILSGVDHLMFIAGLLLFVRSRRRLLITITSFTAAHSLTLAASALDLVHPPRGPVELCIALSILLLAVEARGVERSEPTDPGSARAGVLLEREATRRRRTWTHRAPWVVAFLFGLLHGFGFASALREIGLPPQHVPLALASFNIGVEAGQLLVVIALTVAYRSLVRSARAAERAQAVAVFALGAASVYWCIERAIDMWRTL